MLSIPEFFKNKNILVTGATGFVGKVLIEKLLRSCPDINNIYVIVRPKRGKTLQERISQLTANVIFDELKETNPSSLNKIKAVQGNTGELGLGLSEEDEQLLITQVNIIYHCAAQVNFDIPLRSAILTNVRGARELSTLALKCKDLKALVHVSTMYSNCDRDVIDEKVYPSDINWRDLIDVAEDDRLSMDLEVMSLKYIHPFPNTYTFTKKMSERAFTELCQDKIPLVICRPSIIVYALKEPISGWTDNLNGPFSLLLGTTKGILDVLYGNPETYLDKVFVDNVVKTLIMATWKKCMDSNNTEEVTVYNACTDMNWKIKYYLDVKDEIMWKVPMESRFSYGGTAKVIQWWYHYYIHLILFNVIPAILGDIVLKLSGQKTMLFKYQKKIFMANTFLVYFMQRSFIFKNKGYRELETKIMNCDKDAFAFLKYIPHDVQKECSNIATIGLTGLKKFVLNEKVPIAPETFANTKKFYILHLVLMWLRIFLVAYVLIWKWNLHLVMWNKFSNYIQL